MELHHAIFIEHIYILIQLRCSAAVCNVFLFSHLLDMDLFFFWPCVQVFVFLMEWNSIYCMARPSSTLLEYTSSELIHSSICKVHFSTTEQENSSQLIFTRRLSISTQFALTVFSQKCSIKSQFSLGAASPSYQLESKEEETAQAFKFTAALFNLYRSSYFLLLF